MHHRWNQMSNSLVVLCLSHIDRLVLPHSRRFWGEGLVWLDVGRFLFLQWRRWRWWRWWWWRSEAKDENHQGFAASSPQGRRLRLSCRPCCSCSKNRCLQRWCNWVTSCCHTMWQSIWDVVSGEVAVSSRSAVPRTVLVHVSPSEMAGFWINPFELGYTPCLLDVHI